MDYFGFSIWHDLLTGSKPWVDALELGDPGDFDPEDDGWEKVFACLDKVLADAGVPRGLDTSIGACFHFSSNVPSLMQQPGFDLLQRYTEARDRFSKQRPLQIGMHCTFGSNDLPLCGNYPQVFKKDVELAGILGATCIVAHPTKAATDKTPEFIEELTSKTVIDALDGSRVRVDWENMGHEPRFGSLDALVKFREALAGRLIAMGWPDLVHRHRFCLDTGHLLLWREMGSLGTARARDEIACALPVFASNLGTFHIHANDGTRDAHVVPHSTAFMDHETRAGLDASLFQEFSDDVMDFLAICNEHQGMKGRHVHVEALRLPFSLDQLTGFFKRYLSRFH